ncbi:hypothetical protein [Microbacterium sp. HMWF026]|uniref:hypothetical protein n=1 Tax=Microbacterium sp. HMWF026 TaxID=2056861 RepID=UPI0011B1DDE2|nr:hypothetical protein [Microbacterium sp. HMWF026]
MAVGDAAAAAGFQLVPGSLPANQIETEINRSRDYIAGVQTTRARSKVSSTAPANPQVGDLWFEPI